MKISEQIKTEIQETLGFIPPFLNSLFDAPQILESLWRQMYSMYLLNPLPIQFKEKLFTYLSRFCIIPYGIVCHSCILYSLGVSALEILQLLETLAPSKKEVENHLKVLAELIETASETLDQSIFEEFEEEILRCAIFIFLDQESTGHYHYELRRFLGIANFEYLISLIAYIKTFQVWMEAQRDISCESDPRVQVHLELLLREEPKLSEFFLNYSHNLRIERQSATNQLLESETYEPVDQEWQKSEERLRLALKVAQMGVWEWQPLTGEEFWSSELETLVGLVPGTFEGTYEAFLVRVHPEDRARIQLLEQQGLQAGSYKLEFRIVRDDSRQIRWVMSKGQVLQNNAGQPVRVLGVIQDITDLKQMEESLRERNAQFRQLAENIREVFWMVEPESQRILYVSPAYEAIWGRTCESVLAQPQSWFNAVVPEHRIRLMACLARQHEYNEEYSIQRPDGEIRWIRDRAFPIRDEAGQVYRMVGIAEDITNRKQAEIELRFMQDVTRAVFQTNDFHSALAIALQKVCESTQWDFGEAWIPRPDRLALECSPAWYSKSQSLKEFRNQSQSFSFPMGVGLPGRIWQSRNPEWCQDVSVEASSQYLRTQIALNAGLKAALGVPIIANDEVITVLVFYMFEARDEDQRLIDLISASTELGLFIQRKRAEEEVRQMLQKEKELSDLKSRFITMISHEFRTPLTTILSSAELLEHYRHKLTEDKQLAHLHRIQTNSTRMANMLNDVLLIGKAESGKLGFNPALLNLIEFCQEIVEEFQMSLGSHHKIIFSHQDAGVANVDEQLLRHILTNLLSNAIKYSAPGSTVQLLLDCQATQIVFQIQDQGIGIPLASQAHLFEAFHRADNVGTTQGTGLGLSIVKQCVDLHGGKITVNSETGKGSVFTVSLPS